MNITTTRKSNDKGASQIVARGIGGKQKTTAWDLSKSTDANHGIAAANLIIHVQHTEAHLQYGDNLPANVVRSLDAGYGTHTSNDAGTVHKFDV